LVIFLDEEVTTIPSKPAAHGHCHRLQQMKLCTIYSVCLVMSPERPSKSESPYEVLRDGAANQFVQTQDRRAASTTHRAQSDRITPIRAQWSFIGVPVLGGQLPVFCAGRSAEDTTGQCVHDCLVQSPEDTHGLELVDYI
jgi:hypothetical protein